MAQSKDTRTSRFLSLVLRHKPETIGLELDHAGWAKVDVLLKALASNGRSIERADLERIVAENDKQRFSISDDGKRIRANQGHSIKINLGLEPTTPPPQLYHGTTYRFLNSIFKEGLTKRKRHHVHLSADVETAKKVGSRRGTPALLTVQALAMYTAGYIFFVSDNGVWLTEHVPPEYLSPT